ncbi:6-pyruvoyl tetrahydropterin synthase family protein [Planctomycetota bacterium]
MHKLRRQVRFSLNPFLTSDIDGFNSYVSRPAGEGLSLFFELGIEITGSVETDTGFVVNVVDVDEKVRQLVVPIFARRLRAEFQAGRGIDFSGIVGLLGLAWSRLTDAFGKAKLTELSLKLNPFRKIMLDCEDYTMVYFGEKFEFAATHKLWNDEFSEERNFEVFGKCANPGGHGHNYIVEVTVKTIPENGDFCIGDFERVVNAELIKLLDHKNLNEDLEFFRQNNPTVENIVVFAWDKLAGKFGQAKLHCVTVWETEKTYCSYYGP